MSMVKVSKTNDGLVKIILGMSTLLKTAPKAEFLFDKILIDACEKWLYLYNKTDEEIESSSQNVELAYAKRDERLLEIGHSITEYLKQNYEIKDFMGFDELSIALVDKDKPFIIVAEDNEEKICYLEDYPLFDLRAIHVNKVLKPISPEQL